MPTGSNLGYSQQAIFLSSFAPRSFSVTARPKQGNSGMESSSRPPTLYEKSDPSSRLQDASQPLPLTM